MGRILGRAALVIGVGAAAISLAWLRPLEATPEAVAAMDGGDGVTVTSSATRISLEPDAVATADGPVTGLVFYPGAKVDARAYVPLLLPVAAAGFPVVVVKEPYGIAFFATGAAADVVAARPDVERWAVGGHSLGGTVASMAAGDVDRTDGLLLWASYPGDDISDRDITVASISGTEDGLATPDDIAASRADLPADTTFVAIEGAVHAQFGDYGPQKGDGEPTITDEAAQARIVAASLDLMTAVQAG